MEKIEYRDVVDKVKWPRGPWDNEPDKKQWPDPVTGLPCLVVRGPHGSWCGYVGVAEGHPLYGKGYDAAHDAAPIEVHGGLTFASMCQPEAKPERHICHVPGPGEPDHVWWFGFDCAHAGDLSGMYADYLPENHKLAWQDKGPWGSPGGFGTEHEIYRDLAYVEAEVTKLAQQLAAVVSTTVE